MARIRTLVRRADVAEDLLQDVFVRVYPHREYLDASFAAKYLMRTASNVAKTYRDRLRHEPIATSDLPEISSSETPYGTLLAKERMEFYRGRVVPALDSLSPAHRQALEFYMADGKRIAAVRQLGIPYSTLKSREEWGLRYVREGLKTDVA
ncbi:MAG: RNA polymerase sigma factor [Acidobacteria bacterium]|nr:RNA polymerase sigma factor [Acidobacteriota bacterium]